MITRINKATKADIDSALDAGGYVRYVWCDGDTVLVHPTGWEQAIDGRAYQGFLRTTATRCDRKETGSTEAKDLVFEWRNK